MIPLNNGYLRVLENLSVIERWPLLEGNFKKIVTLGTKCFVRYSWHVRYLRCPLLGGFTVSTTRWLMGWSRTCLWIAGRCVGGGHVGESVVGGSVGRWSLIFSWWVGSHNVGGSVVSGSVVICSVGLRLVVGGQWLAGGRWFCNTPKWSRNL